MAGNQTGPRTWQQDFEDRLFDRLEKETDPGKVREIMETIATGRAASISPDGRQHGNFIDQAIFNRLATTQCPVAEHYRECLRRWGADPSIYPMVPNVEWAMRYGCGEIFDVDLE